MGRGLLHLPKHHLIPGWNSDGTGLFMEEMDSGTVFSAAGISGNSGDYEVSLVFGLSGNGP